MRMNKISGMILILSFMFLFSEIVSASIDLSNIQEEYVYGERLIVNAAVRRQGEFNGFLRMRLLCDDKKTDIFFVPIVMDNGMSAGNEIKIESVPFAMQKEFGEECKVESILTDLDGKKLERVETEIFKIKSKIDFTLELSKRTIKPEETITLFFNVNRKVPKILEYEISLIFDQKKYSFDANGDKFNYSFKMPADLAVGEYVIEVEMNDKYGNVEKKSESIMVNVEPSRIMVETNENIFSVEDEAKFKAMLYDESGRLLLQEKVDVEIIDPNGEKVLDVSARSNEEVLYLFDKNNYQGNYTLIATYEELQNKTSIYLNNKNKVLESDDGKGFKKDINYRKIFTIILAILIILIIGYFFLKGMEKKKDKIFGKEFA